MIYDEDGTLDNEMDVEGGELVSNEDTDDDYVTSLLEGGDEHTEDDEEDGK